MQALPDISEGLENRFLSAVKEASSVEELLQTVKTKRYTMSRLRRVLWCMMMGTTAALQQTAPPYLRVLDFRAGSGQELLREMKKKSTLPVYHSMAKLERDFPAYAAVEKNATMLFNLCCNRVQHTSEYPPDFGSRDDCILLPLLRKASSRSALRNACSRTELNSRSSTLLTASSPDGDMV